MLNTDHARFTDLMRQHAARGLNWYDSLAAVEKVDRAAYLAGGFVPLAKVEPSPEAQRAERERRARGDARYAALLAELVAQGWTTAEADLLIAREHPELVEDATPTSKRIVEIRKMEESTMLTEFLKFATADERAAAVIFKQIETVGAEIGKRDRTLTKEQAIALACRQRPDLVRAHDEAGDATVAEVRERETTLAKRRAAGFERADQAYATAIATIQQRASAAGTPLDHRSAERLARAQYADIYGAVLREMDLA